GPWPRRSVGATATAAAAACRSRPDGRSSRGYRGWRNRWPLHAVDHARLGRVVGGRNPLDLRRVPIRTRSRAPPALEALPLIHLPSVDGHVPESLEATVRLLATDGGAASGMETIVTRLTDVSFVQLLGRGQRDSRSAREGGWERCATRRWARRWASSIVSLTNR